VGIMEAIRPMHTEVMVTEEEEVDTVDMILTEEEVDMDLPLVDPLTQQEAMPPMHTEVILLTEEEVDMDLPLVDPLTQQEAMTPKHPDPDMVDSHTEEMDTELPLDTLTEEAMVRLTEQAVMGHLTLKRSNSSHHSTSMFSIVVPVGTNQHCLPH